MPSDEVLPEPSVEEVEKFVTRYAGIFQRWMWPLIAVVVGPIFYALSLEIVSNTLATIVLVGFVATFAGEILFLYSAIFSPNRALASKGPEGKSEAERIASARVQLMNRIASRIVGDAGRQLTPIELGALQLSSPSALVVDVKGYTMSEDTLSYVSDQRDAAEVLHRILQRSAESMDSVTALLTIWVCTPFIGLLVAWLMVVEPASSSPVLAIAAFGAWYGLFLFWTGILQPGAVTLLRWRRQVYRLSTLTQEQIVQTALELAGQE